MMKKCFAILMSLILLLGSVSVCFAATLDSPDSDSEEYRNAAWNTLMWIKSTYGPDYDSEDIYVSDNKVWVAILKSENIENYSVETFAKYGAIEFDLSPYDLPDYYSVRIKLEKEDKNNVVETAEKIFNEPGILFALPVYGRAKPADPTTPDDSSETTTPAEETTEQTQPSTAVVKPTTSDTANSATPDSAANDSAAAATAVSSANSDNGTVQTGGSAFSVIILSALITAVAFAYFSYMKKQN